ncbi:MULTISPECIES: hypothetical protein [Mesotoga]|uniref:hypothetical protein n=1 Tax=Mesotoga TaxID=1184396 RepID=UPI0002CB0276|nr:MULTISPECIES: hypothetical protein [Mesotoga]MCP5456977.1 hypothetical protein [Thermotogota bacterium]CCU84029.1 hypothetical protein PHOSAC3_120646 [Mesotoga infera]HNQ69812.1 hypothetical protein [Mesotoga prima]HNS75071.1 hypothetical protein [Mesotoga prima]HOP37341.1 hypothetical protein [Mesotoga prima]
MLREKPSQFLTTVKSVTEKSREKAAGLYEKGRRQSFQILRRAGRKNREVANTDRLSANLLEDTGVFQTISSGPDEFSSEAIELAEVLIVHAAEAINRIRNIFEMTRPTFNDPLTGALGRYGLKKFSRAETERAKRNLSDFN